MAQVCCVVLFLFFLKKKSVGVESVTTGNIQNGLPKRTSEVLHPILSLSPSVVFSLALVFELMRLYVCFDSVRRF